MRSLPLILLFVAGVASAQPATEPTPEPAADQRPVVPEAALPEPTPTPVPAVPIAPAPPPTPAKPSEEELLSLANYAPASVSVGGYLQPQFRIRQNSPAQADQDGFRFARARILLGAQTHAGNLDLSATVETELQPQFSLLDAYATVARTFGKSDHDKRALPGRISLDIGQMRTPISRQQMLSDSRIAFVDKAQIATIAPDRDLGVRLVLAPPKTPARLLLGVFNGEGRNQVENINESYLYAARLELSPFGRDAQLAEGAFGGKVLTVGLSYGHNKLSSQANGLEKRTYLGADLFGSYRGLSGSFEYLVVKYAFDGGDPAMLSPDYKGNGWVAQLNYLLPVKLPPFQQSRLELGVRIEEIDRNDVIPIAQPGDPNQSVREITGVVTYYMRMHNLKAQLVFNHLTEIEDKSVVGADATYKNDQAIVQITYRME